MAPPTATSIKTPAPEQPWFLRQPVFVGGFGFLYLLFAGGWTWPLARHLNSHLPLGSEHSATVPLFNLWVLRWNTAWWQGTTSRTYWDAPIFYPAQGTLALSEPQPLTGLFFTLIHGLTQNPILAYNLVLLSILALNGCAGFWLMRRLKVPTGASLWVGVLAQGLPFVTRELGVLQLTVLFPLLFALGALWDFHRRPSWRSGLAIGGWSGVSFLMSSQYALMFSLFLLLSSLLLGRRRHLRPVVAGQLLAGLGLATILLLPFLPQQMRLTAGYQRSESTVRRNSAQGTDYLRLDTVVGEAAWLPWLRRSGGSGQQLYPGSGLLLLAGLGLGGSLINRRRRSWALFCALGTGIAFLLSFGLNLEVTGSYPHALLRDFYPGFAQLRSPFRFAVFGQLLLLNLAGLGLGSLWRWRDRLGRLLAVTVLGLSLVELASLPVQLYPAQMITSNDPWIRWLGGQPTAVAAMFPLPEDGRTRSFEPVTLSMNQALQHGHAQINGYSGFFPNSYRQAKRQLDSFADPASLTYLQSIGVSYLVIDTAWLTAETRQQLRASPLVGLLYEDSTKTIYGISNSSGAR